MITAMILAIVLQCHEAKQTIAQLPKFSIPKPVHEPVNISKSPYETPRTKR